jgi:hypothetical protein
MAEKSDPGRVTPQQEPFPRACETQGCAGRIEDGRKCGFCGRKQPYRKVVDPDGPKDQ